MKPVRRLQAKAVCWRHNGEIRFPGTSANNRNGHDRYFGPLLAPMGRHVVRPDRGGEAPGCKNEDHKNERMKVLHRYLVAERGVL